jgi:hypothetical protein
MGLNEKQSEDAKTAQIKRQKLALDCGAVAGAAIFDYGLYLAWHPLAAIVGGLLVILGCMLSAYDKLRTGGRS